MNKQEFEISRIVHSLEEDFGFRFSKRLFNKVKLAIADAALCGSMDSEFAQAALKICEESDDND